jgi:hypothetical protein
MKQAIEVHGGQYQRGPTGYSPANAEHKFRDHTLTGPKPAAAAAVPFHNS